jgi:hypothetical protein
MSNQPTTTTTTTTTGTARRLGASATVGRLRAPHRSAVAHTGTTVGDTAATTGLGDLRAPTTAATTATAAGLGQQPPPEKTEGGSCVSSVRCHRRTMTAVRAYIRTHAQGRTR